MFLNFTRSIHFFNTTDASEKIIPFSTLHKLSYPKKFEVGNKNEKCVPRTWAWLKSKKEFRHIFNPFCLVTRYKYRTCIKLTLCLHTIFKFLLLILLSFWFFSNNSFFVFTYGIVKSTIIFLRLYFFWLKNKVKIDQIHLEIWIVYKKPEWRYSV